MSQNELKANDEFSGGLGWSEAEAQAVRWNDLLALNY